MENKGTIRLETKRLILRRFVMDDAKAMYNNWATDSKTTEYLTWEKHKSIEETQELVTRWIEAYNELSTYNWIIELKDTHEAIGNISAVKIDEKIEAVEIGYCMGSKWWGNGYMPEALTEVINYLFSKVKLNRIAACHDVNNPKSGRVMDKAGMKTEGIMRQTGKAKGKLYDKKWHSILRSEWEISNV